MALYSGPVVDTHHHIWQRKDISWLADPPVPRMFGDYFGLRRDYPVEEWINDIVPQGATKSVHVTAMWAPTRALDETRWLQSVADKHGFPHGIVCNANLADPDIGAALAGGSQGQLEAGQAGTRGGSRSTTSTGQGSPAVAGGGGQQGDPGQGLGGTAENAQQQATGSDPHATRGAASQERQKKHEANPSGQSQERQQQNNQELRQSQEERKRQAEERELQSKERQRQSEERQKAREERQRQREEHVPLQGSGAPRSEEELRIKREKRERHHEEREREPEEGK